MNQYKEVEVGSYFANQEKGADPLPDNLRAVSFSDGDTGTAVIFSNHGQGINAHRVTVVKRRKGELVGEMEGHGATRRDALLTADLRVRRKIVRGFS